MDRKAYKIPFRKNGRLQWVCPTCKTGVLRIHKDTFNEKETFASEMERATEEWDHQSMEYVYSCLLLCSNGACKDVIASSGVGFAELDVVSDEDDEPQWEWSYTFRPKYFSPHLKIFHTQEIHLQPSERRLKNRLSCFSAIHSQPPIIFE